VQMDTALHRTTADGTHPVTTGSPTPCIIGPASLCSTTREEQGQIRRAPKSRSQPWPRPAISGRSPPQRRLRHAEDRYHLQPFPSRPKNLLLNVGSPPSGPRRNHAVQDACLTQESVLRDLTSPECTRSPQMLSCVLLLSRKQRPGCFAQLL
jgi:hypothetical protein